MCPEVIRKNVSSPALIRCCDPSTTEKGSDPTQTVQTRPAREQRAQRGKAGRFVPGLSKVSAGGRHGLKLDRTEAVGKMYRDDRNNSTTIIGTLASGINKPASTASPPNISTRIVAQADNCGSNTPNALRCDKRFRTSRKLCEAMFHEVIADDQAERIAYQHGASEGINRMQRAIKLFMWTSLRSVDLLTARRSRCLLRS